MYIDTRFQVFVYKALILSSKEKPIKTGEKKKGKDKKEEEEEEETLIFNANVPICGDIKVLFIHGSVSLIFFF